MEDISNRNINTIEEQKLSTLISPIGLYEVIFPGLGLEREINVRSKISTRREI